MQSVYRIFLKGLLTLLPLALTLFFLIWLVSATEALFGAILRAMIPNEYYVPGMGLVVGLSLIFVTGLLFRTWAMRRLWRWWEDSVLERLPMIKVIYGSLKQMVQYFSTSHRPQGAQVVLLTLGDTSMRVMGLMTRDDLNTAPPGLASPDQVAVFLPMSYQLGGYTVYVPRDRVEAIDMSAADALRWTLTAGVTTTKPVKGDGGNIS